MLCVAEEACTQRTYTRRAASSSVARMHRSVFSLAVTALVVAGAAAKDVNCELTAWGAFGACSATCGQSSYKTRSRSVMTAPEGNGTPCLDLMEIKSCDVPSKCPVPCEMAFDDCSICTKTCGGGSKVCVPRVRHAFLCSACSALKKRCVLWGSAT